MGILVLVFNDSGSLDDRDHLRADRIAFIQAVSGTAAVALKSQRLQARQKQFTEPVRFNCWPELLTPKARIQPAIANGFRPSR